jgi:hypothetical protein
MTNNIDTTFFEINTLITNIKRFSFQSHKIYNLANETNKLYVFIDTDEVLIDDRYLLTRNNRFRSTSLRPEFIQAARYLKKNGAKVFGLSRKTNRSTKKREEKAFTKIFYCFDSIKKTQTIGEVLQTAPVDRRFLYLGGSNEIRFVSVYPPVNLQPKDLLIDISRYEYTDNPILDGNTLLESILIYIGLTKLIQTLSAFN